MTLEQRLEGLERENRWMRGIGAVGIAAVAAVLLLGQGDPKELPDLEVRSLAVKDAGGNTRVKMDIVEGAARLSLFTEDTQLGCQFIVRQDDSRVSVLDHGKPAVELFQRNEHGPRVRRPFRGLVSYEGDGSTKRILLANVGSNVTLYLYGAQGGSHATSGVEIGTKNSDAEVCAWSGGDAAFDKESRRFRVFVPGDEHTPSAEIADDRVVIWKAPGE